MATVVLMDGLGGLPEYTFGFSVSELEKECHRAVIVPVKGIVTHEDRVRSLEKTFRAECQFLGRRENAHKEKKIILLGLSAGGSAVRIAAERLGKEEMLRGVILLSPAMPRWICFMTPQLAWGMARYLPRLLGGLPIRPTVDVYRSLVEPLADDQREQALANIQPISGREGRTLAFLPPSFVGHEYPTLYVFGSQDRWVSPAAHRRYCAKMEANIPSFTFMECHDSGHLVLVSKDRQAVVRRIMQWIEELM